MKRSLLVAVVALVTIGAACGTKVTKGPLAPLKSAVKKGGGQAVDPWAGRTDLISSPQVQPASALAIPKYQSFTLRNGLRVIAMPDHQLPLISVELVLAAGGIDDPPGKEGLAQLTASMLRQGVKTMDADAISRTVDAVGVSLSAGAGYERSTVDCGGRSRYLDLCLRMIEHLVLTPVFPEDEMKQPKNELREQVRGIRDDPSALAQQFFFNELYGDQHPAGRPLTLAAIERLGRDDLIGFHRTRYLPAGAVLAISGDFDVDKIQQAVRSHFSRWRRRKLPARAIQPLAPVKPGLSVLLVDKPSLTQSSFYLGHQGVKRMDPDRDALTVMNYSLGGGGFSSRLMQVVRAEGGKTYGISSSFSSESLDGSFSISSFTRTEETLATLLLVRSELEKMAASGVSAEELAAAKGKIAGGYSIRYSTTAQIAGALARARINELPDSYVSEYALRIDKVDRQTANRVAASHLHPGSLVVVIVGNAKLIEPQLRRAKIAFRKVSYLDPISAKARQERATPQHAAPISDAENRVARKLLKRAWTRAGGQKLRAVRGLKLLGSGRIGAMQVEYSVLARPARSELRIAISLGALPMQMVLDGDVAFAQQGKQARVPLPAHKISEMKHDLWRLPPLVIDNALTDNVRARLLAKGARSKGQIAVEVAPPDAPRITLVFDRAYRLVSMRHQGQSGSTIVSDFSAHRRVKGVEVPFTIKTENAGREQLLKYKTVELL
ncbi:MAG: insulinase family protein [Deltaproteobacteria bacterium]|nr:insulinase family protein [Deltaproteobacteria bacterium]